MELYFGPVGSDIEDLGYMEGVSSAHLHSSTISNRPYDPIDTKIFNKTYTVTVNDIDTNTLYSVFGINPEEPTQYSVSIKYKADWDGLTKPCKTHLQGWKLFLTPYYSFKHWKAVRSWRSAYNKWVEEGKPQKDCVITIPNAYINTEEYL